MTHNIDAATVSGFGDEWERFSKQEITEMMEAAGLRRISFSITELHWVAVGYRDVPSENSQ
ncbi:MAG: hypothetical protein ABJN65_11615 [Parasphingorhabdus sp.]